MILDKQDAFEVGPSINPCTKGIWIYCTPLEVMDTDGKMLNLIIIDTEGLGALDEDNNHDNKIFSLSLLLSSCFIFNSLGAIDEHTIENLNLIVNLSKHIHLNDHKNEEQFITENFPVF